MSGDDERARRARGRAHWAGAVLRLDELPEVELVRGAPGELIGLVRDLTLAAWAMRGEALPVYERAETPGRVIRPDDTP